MSCEERSRRFLAEYGRGTLTEPARAEFAAHAGACPRCGPVYEGFSRSDCAWMTRFLADYLEGELPPLEAEVFRWHLAVCADCRVYLATYEAAIRAARDSQAAPAPLPPDLVAAILAARRRA
jgi:anti-sigma factor RsiW